MYVCVHSFAMFDISGESTFHFFAKTRDGSGEETGQIGFEETGRGEDSIQLKTVDCNVNRPFLCCQQPRLVISVSNGRVFEALKADESILC